MAEQLLDWDEVVRILTAQGHKEVEQPYANATVFVTEWGYHFTVPHFSPDKITGKYALLNLLDEVKRTKPP